MSDSSKRDLRKVKTACLLALLLLPGILVALPAVSIFHSSASTGSPAAVVGATATIDDPIYANIGSGLAVTRTIAISNPIGNPSITSITISVPSGATTASPSGTIPANGGVPDCVAVCAASVFGSGPYSLQYTDTHAAAGAVILPAGATILITLQVTPKTTTAVSSTADVFSFSVAVFDNVPSTTQLNSITVYYTTVSSLTNTGPGPAVTQVTAGSIFTFTSTSTQTGLPLNVAIKSGTGTAKDTTISPTSFTSVANSPQTVSVNDTLAPEINGNQLQVTVGAPIMLIDSSGGVLTNSTSTAVQMIAGAATKLTVGLYAATNAVVYNKATQNLNLTSAAWTNSGAGNPGLGGSCAGSAASGCPIAGSNIYISVADKFSNPVTPSSAITLSVSVTTISGQAAGFSTATNFASGAYPYQPTPAPSAGLSITTSSPTVCLSTACATGAAVAAGGVTSAQYYFYGIDYGAQSQITATAPSSSTLSAGSSPMINTWTLSSGLNQILTSTTTPKAGTSFTLAAQQNQPYQANVPTYFLNSTDFSTLSGKSAKALSSVAAAGTMIGNTNVGGTGIATWSVTAPTSDTSPTSATTFYAEEVVGVLSFPILSPGPFVTNSTATGTVQETTVANAFASLSVTAYFTGATTVIVGASPSSVTPFGGSSTTAKTTYGLTSYVLPSKTLYLDAASSDQYGNPVKVGGVTQVTFVASSGQLSTPVANIPLNGQDVASANFGTGTAVTFTAPSAVGTIVTLTVSAAGSSGTVTGSTTVTVVSATPSLTIQSALPTSITSGVPITLSGIVNATKGIFADTISQVQYTVNWKAGATPTTVGIGSANAVWTFSVLLSATGSSAVNITAIDSQNPANVFTTVVQIPPIPTALTFTNSTDLTQINFVGGPAAVAATFTNNGATSLTVIIVANVLNAQGAVILESTATVTAAGGATVTGYPVIQGIAHGTYTVTVTVYSTAYVTLSPTQKLSVTV